MQKVQSDTVDGGPVLRHRVDPAFAGPPVKPVPPVANQLGDAIDRFRVLVRLLSRVAVGYGLRWRRPVPTKPCREIIEHLVGDRDLERRWLHHGSTLRRTW